MSERKLHDSLKNREKAMTKLEDALKIPKDRELVFEGTIQRFEVAIELMWKTLKRALQYEGIKTKSPRETIREAFSIGWLHENEETEWFDMLDYRNTSSHTYLHDDLIEDYYEDIGNLAPILRKTTDFLCSRYHNEAEPTA